MYTGCILSPAAQYSGGWKVGRSQRGQGGSGCKPPAAGQRKARRRTAADLPRPANPGSRSLPSGLGASGLPAKLEPGPGPGARGTKERERAPRARARGRRNAAPRGLSAGWGLLRPSARSCLGEGLSRRPRPGRPGGRRRGRAAARGAAATVACAWGEGGAGAPTHPGRPPPPPPPRPPPRRSILRRGACSRGARVTTAGRAGPSPPPNVCPQGRSADPASAAAAAALRGRRSDVSRLPSERARASGAGGAGGARGGRQGRGCACVVVCAEPGAGREGEPRRERARARGPVSRPPPPTPRPTGSRHLPLPAPPPRPASRPLGAAARMRSPWGRPWRTFSPRCHNVSAPPPR